MILDIMASLIKIVYSSENHKEKEERPKDPEEKKDKARIDFYPSRIPPPYFSPNYGIKRIVDIRYRLWERSQYISLTF